MGVNIELKKEPTGPINHNSKNSLFQYTSWSKYLMWLWIFNRAPTRHKSKIHVYRNFDIDSSVELSFIG